MKLLTCAAIIALTTATAAFAAENDQRAPANTSTSPDQSVTTRPGNPMPQHSAAESSPAGMGGSNSAAPAGQHRTQMKATQDHAMNHDANSRRDRRQMARGQHGAQPNDRAENAQTEQLNRQQIANAGNPSQTANSPTSSGPGIVPTSSGAGSTR
jgi:hypothetical protein